MHRKIKTQQRQDLSYSSTNRHKSGLHAVGDAGGRLQVVMWIHRETENLLSLVVLCLHLKKKTKKKSL